MPKSDQYLLVQNHGEAPVEGYTVLGYSSTRNCEVDGAIGQFGSGAKHAVNLCLRHGLPVWVYCGKTRLEFSLVEEVVNDGLRDDTVYHVVYRKGNGSWTRAGWVLDFGVLDWCDLGMGLREFVSNAIDRTIREEGSIEEARNAGRLSIKIVDDKDRRAKSGFTRIYVALNDEVREYFGQLGKKFLHLSDNSQLAQPGLICKDDNGPAQIYRCGVWVTEVGTSSVFDYNFSADEIKIDECRNSSEYAVKAACARKLKDASTVELSRVFKAQVDGKDVLESTFDDDYLTDYGCLNDTQADRWQEAWESAAGPGAVACDNSFSREYTTKKGFQACVVRSNWTRALGRAGVRTAEDVLTADEQRGRTTLPATNDAIMAVNWAWEVFELAGLVGDRDRPNVSCYRENMSAEGVKMGFQNQDGVHLHIDISNAGQNNELKKTALEEVAHWITGANDNSRDFQQFFIDALVNLA